MALLTLPVPSPKCLRIIQPCPCLHRLLACRCGMRFWPGIPLPDNWSHPTPSRKPALTNPEGEDPVA